MALNLYVMPITGTGTRPDPRTAKYASTMAGFNWGMYDYGNEPWAMVGVIDIDGTTDSSLTGNADCMGLPTALDVLLTSGQVTTVTNKLEAVNIPGTWVTTSNTWRQVIEFVGAVCQFAQRYQGINGARWFTGGVTLATTFGSLPAGVRTAIQAAATSFNFDTSGITGSSTLRAIITSAGSQYISMGYPLILAGADLYTV